MSCLHYLCLFGYSGVYHKVRCVFLLFFFLLCTLCCPFLWIVHFWLLLSVFSNVYLDYWNIRNQNKFLFSKISVQLLSLYFLPFVMTHLHSNALRKIFHSFNVWSNLLQILLHFVKSFPAFNGKSIKWDLKNVHYSYYCVVLNY